MNYNNIINFLNRQKYKFGMGLSVAGGFSGLYMVFNKTDSVKALCEGLGLIVVSSIVTYVFKKLDERLENMEIDKKIYKSPMIIRKKSGTGSSAISGGAKF